MTRPNPDPTNPAAWKWKSGAFRRVLTTCETEATAEKFIAQEFAGIYMAAYIHGREGITYTDNTSKPKMVPQKHARATDRLISAAMEFCRQEDLIRRGRQHGRQKFQPCTSPPQPGEYFGPAPCDDPETACEACRERLKTLGPQRGSLRQRYNAKRRMLRAFRAMGMEGPLG